MYQRLFTKITKEAADLIALKERYELEAQESYQKSFAIEKELDKLIIEEKLYETDFSELAGLDVKNIEIFYTEEGSEEIKKEHFYGSFTIKIDEYGHFDDIQKHDFMWNEGFSWSKNHGSYIWSNCAGTFKNVNILGYCNVELEE